MRLREAITCPRTGKMRRLDPAGLLISNTREQVFTQQYGAPALDASELLLMMGFLPLTIRLPSDCPGELINAVMRVIRVDHVERARAGSVHASPPTRRFSQAASAAPKPRLATCDLTGRLEPTRGAPDRTRVEFAVPGVGR